MPTVRMCKEIVCKLSRERLSKADDGQQEHVWVRRQGIGGITFSPGPTGSTKSDCTVGQTGSYIRCSQLVDRQALTGLIN